MTQSKRKESQDDPLGQESLQRIMQVGSQASELLASPVYNMVYQRLMTDLHGQWLTTEPKEERKRESLWMQAKGLEKVTISLSGAVEDAHRVLQENAQKQDPKQKENEYLDNQGFGVNYR